MSSRPPHVQEQVYKYYKYLNPHPRELIAAKQPPRIFIREGEVSQWRPKERGMKRKFLILFDDTLVVCRRNNRTSYVTKIIFRLTAGTLKCALVSNSSYYIKGVEFRIWNKTRTFVFFGKSPSNALSWVRDIVYAMNGGRIPYRPVVDPKTGEEIDGEGEKKDKDLLKLMEKRREEDRVSGGNKGKDADFLAGVNDRDSFKMPASGEDGGDLIPNFDPFSDAPASSSSSSSGGAQQQQQQSQDDLVPYNPFLSVGNDPFNPFGTDGQQQQQFQQQQQQQQAQQEAMLAAQQAQMQQQQQQPDWTMMLEKAAMDLCLFGKSTILDLEQMRELDKNLVDSEVHNAAKQSKGNYEVLYQGTTRLANERDPGRRQAEAQNLAKIAAMNLPAMRQFVFQALNKVESVKDDFAKGRQRYMLQVLDKAILSLFALLPPEIQQQQAQQQQPQQAQQQPKQAAAAPAGFGDWDPFGSSNEAGNPQVSKVEAEMTEIVQAVKQSANDLNEIIKENEQKQEAPTATIQNTMNMTTMLAELLNAATEAEKSLGEAARKSGQAYHRDPAWENGLISAAKSVLQNVGLLVNSAKSVNGAPLEEVEAECDTLLACVRSMNGATARLVMASRVKIPAGSPHGAAMDTAAANVKRAAGELESSTLEQALANKKEEKKEEAPAQEPSAVKKEAEKLNAMSKVAKLERELELARQQLSGMNAGEYKQ
mmetsp:Transcript_37248/g.58654  ORF Transcript_37248/g.58654 Transcript_37248/m.58654 type:complete len:708 (-) Transcript_37248:123-2246(-)|eukprot:CAMPEP_0201521162 /NCGR_PEP_ID=MMETSP0161_2-20130828/14251_1 /ASSEMBLY_ACC=CAM_ASM_000251 /TAXON_ID=180227 /ORGANISM="Neoparamoeba aestuarina, Strain SoJaBio B1-5/56/2" /LENGTH=707 /DNA_ID=CAMNT_0047919741 /DNA_START=59 /DNA_END=2182 /DNA_ORIENTATION=+